MRETESLSAQLQVILDTTHSENRDPLHCFFNTLVTKKLPIEEEHALLQQTADQGDNIGCNFGMLLARYGQFDFLNAYTVRLFEQFQQAQPEKARAIGINLYQIMARQDQDGSTFGMYLVSRDWNPPAANYLLLLHAFVVKKAISADEIFALMRLKNIKGLTFATAIFRNNTLLSRYLQSLADILKATYPQLQGNSIESPWLQEKFTLYYLRLASFLIQQKAPISSIVSIITLYDSTYNDAYLTEPPADSAERAYRIKTFRELITQLKEHQVAADDQQLLFATLLPVLIKEQAIEILLILLANELISNDQYISTLAEFKEAIYKLIIQENNVPSKIQLLEQALTPTHSLGRFFHIQRGHQSPSPVKGTLSKINTKLIQLKAPSCKRQLFSNSKEIPLVSLVETPGIGC